MGRDEELSQSFSTAPEPEKPKRENLVRTVYLGRDIMHAIDRLATEWELSPSAVTRWLIRQGLETGKTPPQEAVRKVDP